MAQPPSEDPFHWDTDRVCQELCCDGVEWTNDASALESLLRENFMDGETLLTYELAFSRKELIECLGITAARHRAKLIRKILQLQKQSPKFREEKKSIETDGINQVFLHTQMSTLPVAPPSQSPFDKTSSPPMQPLFAIAEKVGPLEEFPRKRRRIAPTFVTDISASAATQRMPGFEEPELGTPHMVRVADASFSGEEVSTAYLGKKAVADMVPLEPDYSSDSGSDTFYSVNAPQPRGKTRAIYSRLKKYLLKNNRKILTIQSGVKVSTSSDGDRDVIDFDDLASLDEDTIREMANEEAESKQANSSFLASEKIEEIINEEICKFQAQWQENKLPKLERKAYRLWGQAKKHSLLRRKAFEAQQEARHFRDRLSTLTRDLRGLPWKTSEELRFQTCIVEQTVVDKLRQEWLANLFSLRSVPPKRSHPHTQTHQQPRPRRVIHGDQLSSSSEEESNLEDFIVDDDSVSARAISPVPQQNIPSPSTSCHLPLAHSNNHSVPHSPVSSVMAETSYPQTVIDLTMASDVEMDGTAEKLLHRGFDEFTQDALAQIGEKHPKHWARKGDRFRLVISILWRLDIERREAFFHWLGENGVSDIWRALIDTAQSRIEATGSFKQGAVFDLMLVYLSFQKCKYRKEEKISKLKPKDVDKMEHSEKSFPLFCEFLGSIQNGFPKRNQIARLDEFGIEGFVEIDGFPDQTSTKSGGGKKKNKKKAIILDRSGVELRERAERDMREQERRRDELRASIQKNNTVDAASARAPRFIINESKTDDQNFIYVNPQISCRIKDHQIEGVRFLWNHIVRHESERQGCLLAHTMGLGKTMQTITFLVALRESALTDQLRDQIPKDLRDWKVLVLCPAGLVENWKDEFAIWAPEKLMGNIVTIEAAKPPAQRIQNAKDWVHKGGVLIIGYTMFKSGFRKGDGTPTSLDRILVDNATVVIADEAHLLKDPKTNITQVASEIKTSNRIALTGSPLANNVEEYYAMINWVAPNFLGPLQEFRDMYATPIHQGLYHDSSSSEKRMAIKMLQVLKTTAAPKVHRATIKSCLKHELPPKEEFVISVPPTEIQRKLYDLYIQGNGSDSSDDRVNQANLFGILNHLALICAHPAVYRKRAIELNVKSEKGHEVARFPMATIGEVLKITAGQSLERTELSYKVELLNKILDQSARLGDKVLVFSQSIPTLDYLEKLFASQRRESCRLDGNTKIDKRQEMVKNFNTGSTQVYLISTNAGGVGLNIHGANRVVIFDFKWNPVSDQQAIGRAYRIGQRKPVFVYRFVVAGSFEEDLQNKAVFKTQLAARVVDQKNVVSWSKRLANLIHKIKHVDATESRFDFKGKDVILDHLLDHADTRAITSVMSSDTFEEEDETETLTAEERKEADSMVERHNMRVADPEKYSQMMQTERTGNNQRAASHIVSGKPNKDGFSERPDPAYQSTGHYSYLLSQSSGPASAPAPAPAPAPATTKRSLPSSGPMPMLGSNTFYGNGGPRMTVVQASSVPNNGKSAFNAASSAEAREQFRQKLAAALSVVVARNQPIPLDALAKADSITAEIEVALSERNEGHAADTLHWNMLAGKVENERFLLAIAAARFSGRFLGATEEGAILERLQDLELICEKNSLDLIREGGKSKDPEALEDLRAIRRASTMRNGERRSDVRSDLRSDLRTDQGPELPSWANNIRGQGRLAESLLSRR
ncbi:SNF2-related protein [Cordyceps fumosorosea ARSEF 2679]|uniref:SNF2-related protein n=1 Tax=Cordyceps fumosorosea (strain ARSEF 2679) TaxID=1081104 RepID=A0A162JIC7_CORFA|nr:SNF2-related protein [Cordyceps fumosorosea ARSEF 2679]OAA69432.1 SNF2-related protein [Cordyceps fumosorosea ARSEF 2679]